MMSIECRKTKWFAIKNTMHESKGTMREHKRYNLWNALVEKIWEVMGLRIKPISPNIQG